MAFYTTLVSYRTILSNKTYNVYLQTSIINGTQKIDSLLLNIFVTKTYFPVILEYISIITQRINGLHYIY